MNTDGGSQQITGIKVNDVPNFEQTSLNDVRRFVQEADKLPEAQQRGYWKNLSDTGRLGVNRIWLGNTDDKGSALQLKDGKGRIRMLLKVAADGKAEIQMLDEQGKITKSITSVSND